MSSSEPKLDSILELSAARERRARLRGTIIIVGAVFAAGFILSFSALQAANATRELTATKDDIEAAERDLAEAQSDLGQVEIDLHDRRQELSRIKTAIATLVTDPVVENSRGSQLDDLASKFERLGSSLVVANVLVEKLEEDNLALIATITNLEGTQAVPDCVPNLLSPDGDATLDNGTSDRQDSIEWEFSWSSCKSGNSYQIMVQRKNAVISVIDEVVTENYFHYVNVGAYTGGVEKGDWSWRVRARIDDRWAAWSESRFFQVEPVDSDLKPTKVPDPDLAFSGTEQYTTAAGEFTRFKLEVTNNAAFPEAMFEPAPNLPPCGLNNNSSRTWVSIFSADDDRRLYGFCGLGSPSALTQLWFAVSVESFPPNSVYITIEDRQEGVTYRSKVVDLTGQ